MNQRLVLREQLLWEYDQKQGFNFQKIEIWATVLSLFTCHTCHLWYALISSTERLFPKDKELYFNDRSYFNCRVSHIQADRIAFPICQLKQTNKQENPK